MTIASQSVQLIAAAALVVMAGCGNPGRARFESERDTCYREYPAKIGFYEDRARCFAGVVGRIYPDNAGLKVAAAAALAWSKDLDSGEISREEAEFRMQKLAFELDNTSAQTRAAETSALMLLLRR